MAINWSYLGQQGLLVLYSAIVATALLAAARALLRRPPTAWRLGLELPVIGLLLFVAGESHRALGLEALLPGARFPWTVGTGLAFYWMVLWWPLRVVVFWRSLRASVPARAVVAAAVLLPLVALYACFIEPRWLECEHVELVLPDVGAREIRIAHVSDTQLIAYGAREQAMVTAINAFAPHLIVFTGDYIAGPAGEAQSIAAMRRIFDELCATHGIFATTSDSDTPRQRRAMFEGLPVQYLLNRSTVVEVEGVAVRIGGLNHYAPHFRRMAAGVRRDELFVVACHTPDWAQKTARRLPLADLYLCGHTHGGQLQIPWLGPLLTMSEVPRHVAAGGVFRAANGMPYLVTRGVGMEGDYAPRFRLFCRPHLFLITLRGPGRDQARLEAKSSDSGATAGDRAR